MQNQYLNRTKPGGGLIYLAAHGLLVLPAALLSALVGLDAEAGPASGAVGRTGGARDFLLVMEQLHKQLKLRRGKAGYLQMQRTRAALL